MAETSPTYDTNGAIAVLPRSEPPLSDAVALAISQQNLKDLSDAQKVEAIRAICAAAQLPVALSPIMLLPGEGGRLVPYVTAAGTNTIRANKRISIAIVDRQTIDGVHIVRARATASDGTVDESTGAVPTEGLKGVALANALMKAETKAKRRVTLSIAGIGFMDESEIDQVRGAGRPISVTVREDDGETIEVDPTTGEILDVPTLVDWLKKIADANDADELQMIGEQMREAGISSRRDRELLAAYNQRKIKLAEQTRATADADARDGDQAELMHVPNTERYGS